jgi:hypothetical protein
MGGGGGAFAQQREKAVKAWTTVQLATQPPAK